MNMYIQHVMLVLPSLALKSSPFLVLLLVLFLRANPNLRNLFFRVLSEISRLWYAAKDFTIVTDESNK